MFAAERHSGDPLTSSSACPTITITYTITIITTARCSNRTHTHTNERASEFARKNGWLQRAAFWLRTASPFPLNMHVFVHEKICIYR